MLVIVIFPKMGNVWKWEISGSKFCFFKGNIPTRMKFLRQAKIYGQQLLPACHPPCHDAIGCSYRTSESLCDV